MAETVTLFTTDPTQITVLRWPLVAKPTLRVTSPKRDSYILIAPVRPGLADVIANGRLIVSRKVHPGILYVASPGEKILTYIRKDGDVLSLNVPSPLMQELLSAGGRKHRPGRYSYIDPLLTPSFEVERLARLLFSSPHLPPPYSSLLLNGVASSLIAFLLAIHDGHQALRRTRGLDPIQLRRALDYAEAMLREGVDVDAWAAILAMPIHEFSRRFLQSVGCSPYAWFLQRRVERAMELLRNPKLSFVEIAFQTGFANQSHFTESFRKRTGLPPARWRARYIEHIKVSSRAPMHIVHHSPERREAPAASRVR